MVRSAATILLLIGAAACSALAQEMRSGYVETSAGSIYYDVVGSGPDLVLMHDGMVHSVGWDAQVREFESTHRVIRFDRRGYGRSDTPTERYSPIADVELILDELRVESAVVIGASAGGALAVEVALAFPERVVALVLAGAVVRGYGFSEHFRSRGAENMPPAMRGDFEAAALNWSEDRYFTAPGNDDARKELLATLKPVFEKHFTNSPDLVIQPQEPAVDLLDRIQVPTLILVGEADIPDVHAHAGVLETGIEGASRTVVPNAGHLVFLERPGEFNRLVRTFLESR